MPTTQVLPLRVAKRVLERCHWEGDCLITDMGVGNHGYGRVMWKTLGNRDEAWQQLTHRAVWWIYKREIDPGMTIDHICRNRKCINIEHLRLLTNEENGRLNGNAVKRACPQGHPYSPTNTYTLPSGQGRWCIICTKSKWIRKKELMKTKEASV